MNTPRLGEDRLEPAALARTLAWLRVYAVLGQSATVALVAWWLRLPLPYAGLVAGIAALGLFAVGVLWRLRQAWPVSASEILWHVGFDTIVLGYLLYLTGGASNPFVGLLLMPITLAAMILRGRQVLLVTLLCIGTYLALLRWYIPLPGVHLHMDPSGFGLHVIGMAVSFALSAALLGGFIGRLARALRIQHAQMQRIRERALRDEGILAIATQAAGAAHELNTPLSTMQTLLTELRREHPDGALASDLQLLATQVQRCSSSLRELVAVGKAQLSGAVESTRLTQFVDDNLDRFRLLRPEIEIDLAIEAGGDDRPLQFPAGLRHAFMNLLNNAADASFANGSNRIGLDVRREREQLVLCITDQGSGLTTDADATGGRPFHSTKHAGLGIGLALADSTAERLGGELTLDAAAGGGVATRLVLPLARLTGAGDAAS